MQEIQEEEKASEQQQELSNLLVGERYAAALSLALTLNMPYRCLGVVNKMLALADGTAQLRCVIENLQMDQIESLLEYISTWNTNAKHTVAAQTALFALLSSKQSAKLSGNPKLRTHWEALVPYTDRHLERLTKLQQQATFLQYTWDRMKLSEITS